MLHPVRDPVEPGVGETAGFAMLGCVAAAVVVATAAAASGAAPAAASEIEVEETSGILSNPGQEDHRLGDQLHLQYSQSSLGQLLFHLHFLHECEDYPWSLPYSLLVKVHPVWAAVAQLAGDTVGHLHWSRSCCCCWPADGHLLQDQAQAGRPALEAPQGPHRERRAG